MENRIYTVSELTREIKQLLETGFPRLWVEGEISNCKYHSSGHIYFTLKDDLSQIKCAMWRSRANGLLFRLQDGIKVILQGDMQVYERGGNYQLSVFQLQPAGIGELQLAFEQLKKRLLAEGLFDEGHKKAVPPYPECVGVVTSPTGAAIRDIISVVKRRSPATRILIYPVRVQGEGAAAEIVTAIEDFNKYGKAEVLIVGRGGGSLEDLWAFNEEIVARAIYASEIPVISAVGHEVDFSIADFVADHRAPTPSAAAELVVRDKNELLGILQYYSEKAENSLLQKIQSSKDRILNLQKSYAFKKPQDLIQQKMQRLDELTKSIHVSTRYALNLKNQRLTNMRNHLNALSPIGILQRGYSICYKEGEIVKDVAQVKPLDMVEVRLAKGQFISQVQLLGESE